MGEMGRGGLDESLSQHTGLAKLLVKVPQRNLMIATGSI